MAVIFEASVIIYRLISRGREVKVHERGGVTLLKATVVPIEVVHHRGAEVDPLKVNVFDSLLPQDLVHLHLTRDFREPGHQPDILHLFHFHNPRVRLRLHLRRSLTGSL